MDLTKLCTLKKRGCLDSSCEKCGWNARVAEGRKDIPYTLDKNGRWRKKVGGK